jgi:carbamoyl-phosphate synthase large subunit
VRPVFKRIDTCAGEFASDTPYMYSTYEGGFGEPVCESRPTDRQKVVILGGGPNRIGQGIEFDYCCVHACYALKDAGFETIMVNCNPETVSTDYDTADRLYFEPLTNEDVIALIRKEQENGTLLGCIVQYGGQTPLKLSQALDKAGIPILGTSAEAIDIAEDRERFQILLKGLGLKQPRTASPATRGGARRGHAHRLPGRGAPQLRAGRPRHGDRLQPRAAARFGAGGREGLGREPDPDRPVPAGRHRGGCGLRRRRGRRSMSPASWSISRRPASIPATAPARCRPIRCRPPSSPSSRRRPRRWPGPPGRGLMNVQYAVKDGEIFVLEVNPRASRTVPFVAKATGVPVAKIGARVMAGAKLSEFKLDDDAVSRHVAVKEAVFPFNRFPGVDVILGPEMKSTGEVMGLDTSFERAFLKSQLGAGVKLPESGTAFVSVRESDKAAAVTIARRLAGLGFKIMATRGTAARLREAGLEVHLVNKVMEGRPHCVDAIKSGEIQIVINTSGGGRSVTDSFDIRRSALTQGVPHYTTIAGARAAAGAIAALLAGTLDVAPLQSYSTASF